MTNELIAVVRDRKTKNFIGLYSFQSEATFLRGAGVWHRATGAALSKINGALLTPVDVKYVEEFDKADAKGTYPDPSLIEP